MLLIIFIVSMMGFATANEAIEDLLQQRDVILGQVEDIKNDLEVKSEELSHTQKIRLRNKQMRLVTLAKKKTVQILNERIAGTVVGHKKEALKKKLELTRQVIDERQKKIGLRKVLLQMSIRLDEARKERYQCKKKKNAKACRDRVNKKIEGIKSQMSATKKLLGKIQDRIANLRSKMPNIGGGQAGAQ